MAAITSLLASSIGSTHINSNDFGRGISPGLDTPSEIYAQSKHANLNKYNDQMYARGRDARTVPVMITQDDPEVIKQYALIGMFIGGFDDVQEALRTGISVLAGLDTETRSPLALAITANMEAMLLWNTYNSIVRCGNPSKFEISVLEILNSRVGDLIRTRNKYAHSGYLVQNLRETWDSPAGSPKSISAKRRSVSRNAAGVVTATYENFKDEINNHIEECEIHKCVIVTHWYTTHEKYDLENVFSIDKKSKSIEIKYPWNDDEYEWPERRGFWLDRTDGHTSGAIDGPAI